jgi:glyoxalase family protein
LFEIATDTPSIAHDESVESVGEGLTLPVQYEGNREQLESPLIPFEVREIN